MQAFLELVGHMSPLSLSDPSLCPDPLGDFQERPPQGSLKVPCKHCFSWCSTGYKVARWTLSIRSMRTPPHLARPHVDFVQRAPPLRHVPRPAEPIAGLDAPQQPAGPDLCRQTRRPEVRRTGVGTPKGCGNRQTWQKDSWQKKLGRKKFLKKKKPSTRNYLNFVVTPLPGAPWRVAF